MSSSPPAYTETKVVPAWKPGQGGEWSAYDDIYDHAKDLYIDPITGQPRQYTGPSHGMRSFDPYEQMGYSRAGGMAQSGVAGGYAQNYAQDLYGNLNPMASRNLQGGMRGQYLTPTSQLQGSDRLAAQNVAGLLGNQQAAGNIQNMLGNQLAAQNVDDILSGKRLDPSTNPAMQRVMDAVGKQVRRERDKSTGEAAGAFSQMGTLGSSGHRKAQQAIERNMDETIADSTSKMMSDFYTRESGARDQLAAQRLGAQDRMAAERLGAQDRLAADIMSGSAQNRMGTAGSVFNLGSQYDLNRQNFDADRLMKLGAYRRGQITDPNIATDFANRNRAWAWQQDAPMNLANIIALLTRGSGQVTDTTQRGGGASPAATTLASAQLLGDVATSEAGQQGISALASLF